MENERYCLNCGKKLTSRFSKKFCSHSCAATFNNKGVVRNGNKKIITECLNCGKKLKSNQKKYCSRKCQYEYEFSNYIKKWKNDEINGTICEDSISQVIKRYLFEKYNNSCQLCGWNKVHPITGLVPLQVHHIDGDCTNNKEDNLQLLCPNCHALTENFSALNKGKSNRKKRYNKIIL